MTDDEEPPENQATVVMKTSAANGFDGNEVRVVAKGGPGDSIDDVNTVAKQRFEHAVMRTGTDDYEPQGYE